MSAPNATQQQQHQHHSKPRQRSCDSLGACQCRLPACLGCTWVSSAANRVAQHAFAPGVVTVHPSARLSRLRRWARQAYTWGRLALLAALVLASLAMALGYLVGSYMAGV
jgi:hypothetical protein